jgi:branched-chain amino acid transport system substrate-binding protein
MKKIAVTVVCLGILFSMPLFAGGGGEAQQENAIRIGFYGPLSGPMSLSGIASQQGADLAIKQINEKGGILGKNLVLVPYDDKSSPEQAVKVVTRMIDSDKVHAIIGSLHSGNILASAPVAEKAKIPEVGIGTSPVWLQKGYTYLFRSVANTNIIAVQLVQTIASLGYKKIGALGRSDEYGKSGVEDMKTQLEPLGVQVFEEWFHPGDTDFTGQLTKLINSGIDGLIAYGVDADQGPIMKQARQNGFTGLVFGPESLSVPSVKEVAGKDAEGAVFGSSYVIPEKAEDAINTMHIDFFRAFVAEYRKMPDSQTAMRCYDAVYLIAEAIKKANSLDGTAIRDQLASIQGFEGLAGIFTFSGRNGEGINEARIFAVKDGKDILLSEFMKSFKK